MPLTLAAAFVLAVLLAVYFTPVIRRAAERHDIVDVPDGRLKRHARPVAYLGGLAIYVAFVLTLGAVLQFDIQVLGLLLSASIVLLLGLIDDLGALSPSVKFLGQLFGIAVLIKAGVRVEITALADYPILSVLLTVLWVAAVTNAFNIIDVADGVASGVAAVALLFLAGLAFAHDEPGIAVFTVALAGATLGFLPFNFAPARIYLGDTGSMFLGFLTAALSMQASFATRHDLGLAAPVLLLAVPLFDTAFVAFHRIWRGQSPFRGSPDHFAVRLRRAGVAPRTIALGSYAVATVFGVIAVTLPQYERRTALIVLAGCAAFGLAAAVILSRIGVPPTSAPGGAGAGAPSSHPDRA